MERFEAEQKRKRLQNSFGNSPSRTALFDGNSSQKPSIDPALQGQDTTTGQKDAEETSKIEPKHQFRSLKGDRFS
ncbi:BgTH12-07389 [Blumeria graminis f. sp. triticale]|uniref:BgtA-21124 n=3 Tax=Blumeria graminis TaxID=34373 RepID=A0A9X9LAG7_BLUGR|nr:BgTH12-07389 [Blumeria graminis f. sp. triticale]VCU40453.1 BgtA-21124 [Blumeria graminis f. sp. tritici]